MGHDSQTVTRQDDATTRFLQYVHEHDQHAIEEVLHQHAQCAYAQAARLLGNGSDAQDAVQDAMLKLVRSADRFDGSVPFGAWLGRLVHTAAIDLQRSRRRRQRRETIVAATIPTSTRKQDDLTAEQIRQEIAVLPEQYRLPLDLHFLTGLSTEETARALGLSDDVARMRIQRAKSRLIDRLRRRGIMVLPAAVFGMLTVPTAAAAPETMVAYVLNAVAVPKTAAAFSFSAALPAIGLASVGVLGLALAVSVGSPFAKPNEPEPLVSATIGKTDLQAATPPYSPDEQRIDTAKVIAEYGFAYCYYAQLGEPHDSNEAPRVSRLALFENGIRLGPAHTLHREIRDHGNGRFSHWHFKGGQVLYFSASDNSDPRVNGRTYTYRVEPIPNSEF
jgi:RNA polymerase sigma factor (sigma-70 family)